MAEKPPEEGYISVVDEEPEIFELLKWDAHQNQTQKAQEPRVEKKTVEKRVSKYKEESDPFDLPDPTFIETYRLPKDLARSLCEELKPVMPDCIKSIEFSVESKVLATLAFYATGKFQKTIGGKSDPNITQYFMLTAVIQVTEAFNHVDIARKYIHFPHLRAEREALKNSFYMKYGIPNVVGCIDCTHVPLARPENDQKNHFNKSYHSKKVQIICDSDLNIISVEANRGGSCSHDVILNQHALKYDLESMNNGGEQCWLIGGPHYTQKPYIMTPIPKISKRSPVSPEKYYSNLHSQAFNAVTETIKHLKTRWKCLQATCNKQFDPATVSMIIVACCVLHNICNKRGLPLTPMTQTEERLEAMKQKVANAPISRKQTEETSGTQTRLRLVERLWNERRVVPECNQPRKRMSKKERILDNHHHQLQNQVQIHQINHQPHQHQLVHEDASKRPRILMNNAYLPMGQAWGHYPQH